MDTYSVIGILNLFKKLPSWILKKCNRKIVKNDEYQEKTEEVGREYIEKSSQCIQEKQNGSKFRWTDKFHPGYERYFELKERNVKRYFKSKNASLWIKRLNKNN